MNVVCFHRVANVKDDTTLMTKKRILLLPEDVHSSKMYTDHRQVSFKAI